MPDQLRNRRGRPLKFGRPATPVAISLPDDVIAALRAIDDDLGRAVVKVVQAVADPDRPPAVSPAVGLSRTGRRQALIMVNPELLPSLPGCSYIRTSGDQAFIALKSGAGAADLEVAVIDRLGEPGLDERQRVALGQLRDDLRRWRQDRRLRAHARGIIILEEAS